MIPFVRVRDGKIIEQGFTDEDGFTEMQKQSSEYQDIDEEHLKISPGQLLRQTFDSQKMRKNILKKKPKPHAP